MLYLIISILFLGIAVSIDSFAVGVTYGMRKILTPFRALMIISLCTGISIFTAMIIGDWLSGFVSTERAEMTGGLLLIVIGVWALYQIYKSKTTLNGEQTQNGKPTPFDPRPPQTPSPKKWSIEWKRLGIVIEIMKKPQKADMDNSGTISIKEALILGLALSLDAFGAGIGAALLGYPVLLTTILIAFMSGTLVFIGYQSGKALNRFQWVEKLRYLPGAILISVGVANIFF